MTDGKVICAVCNKVLGVAKDTDGHDSHGYCPDCTHAMLIGYGFSREEIEEILKENTDDA